MLADCAKRRSFPAQEEAKWLSWIKMQSLLQLLCSSLVSFFYKSTLQLRNKEGTAELCLADLREIAGFAKASDELGGGDVKEMWVSGIIRGLGGQ